GAACQGAVRRRDARLVLLQHHAGGLAGVEGGEPSGAGHETRTVDAWARLGSCARTGRLLGSVARRDQTAPVEAVVDAELDRLDALLDADWAGSSGTEGV